MTDTSQSLRYRVLDGEQTADFNTWSLPSVDGQQVQPTSRTASQQSVNAADKEAVMQQAYDEGFQRGIQAGQAEITALQQQLQDTLDLFDKPLQLVDQEVERQLLSMVEIVASRIVASELSIRPELLAEQINQVIKQLPFNQSELTLRLNQEDLAVVEQLAPQQSWQHLRFEADESLGRGEITIQSLHSQIDNSVRAAVNRLVEQHLPQPAEVSDD